MLAIGQCHLKNPVKIYIEATEDILDGVDHYAIEVDSDGWKIETLLQIWNSFGIEKAIVYCNTKRSVEALELLMKVYDFKLLAVHGELEKAEQIRILR